MDHYPAMETGPRWRRRWRRFRNNPWDKVLELTGDRTVGGHSVPTTWRHSVRVSEDRIDGRLAVGSADDAFGLYVRRYYDRPGQDPEESPVWEINRHEARWLVGYIVRWRIAVWFGLRRRIYYWALTKSIARQGIAR